MSAVCLVRRGGYLFPLGGSRGGCVTQQAPRRCPPPGPATQHSTASCTTKQVRKRWPLTCVLKHRDTPSDMFLGHSRTRATTSFHKHIFISPVNQVLSTPPAPHLSHPVRQRPLRTRTYLKGSRRAGVRLTRFRGDLDLFVFIHSTKNIPSTTVM